MLLTNCSRRLRLGVALGLVFGGMLVLWAGQRAEPGSRVASLPHGRLLSDCEGTLKDLVVHYTPQGAQIVEGAYRDFLRSLPADVTVRVVCPDLSAFHDLLGRVGTTRCDLQPVAVGHPITCWSRDRWLAFEPTRESSPAVLITPAVEDGAEAWGARAGDHRTAADLAAALLETIATMRGDLSFDGGDFVADGRTVFVTPRVLPRNLGRSVADRAELTARLSEITGLRVVLLAEAPPHHAGMFMMCAGEGRVLVGDPSLARSQAREVAAMIEADWSDETQALFDAVAGQCKSEGYRVVRMPVVPGCDGRTWLTWLNVIIDQRPAGRAVYMPVFDGVDTLNEAAAATWRDLGYRVVPVDCTGTYRHFGSLRCLVNVARRRVP